MVEAVVQFVLKNLADFIVNEAQFLGGVGNKVEQVQRELIRIKCCLKDADSKKKGDERVQNWLNELRDVAYRITDATDTYFLPVEDHHQKEASNRNFCQKVKKVFKKPMNLPHLHKLGTELDYILNLLQEIYDSRDRYGIQELLLEDKTKREPVRMPLRRATYSEVEETEVVGMQADKNNILELLRPEKTARRAVVTIVGVGGLGKTTLACMVYKSAQENFNYHIMLSISQQFSLTDLMRKMIRKYNDSVPKDEDIDYYVGELKSFLSSKRYLIILDDVWTGDLWNELKEVFVDGKNGSRVLITSRFIEVANSTDSQFPPYQLKLLDDRESLKLLLKKALPYEECPNDLLELARELSNKCKGLPLALIVLGGILSTKELSHPAWKRVLQTMNWHSDGSGCMQILAMSYEDMPYYLKACFQFLASFPEDYVISAKSLIRIWVAEGFIPLEGKTTIEIMAEDCLEELAKRSMVQVLSRTVNGLIKNFTVHDILRELALHEAGNENFVTVFSHASNDPKPSGIIRRASLQDEEKNSQFMKYVGPKTRSLLHFVPETEISLDCSNFRLLKVLDIEFKSLVLKSLDELIHLKYLSLRGIHIDHFSCSFQRMRSLETLDVREFDHFELCDDFWSISTLRHVLGNFERPLPNGIVLNHLQTLQWVTVKRPCGWKLPNLRKLGITNQSDEWVSITNLLQTLPLLVSLGIFAKDHLPIEIVYPKALPNYQNLQSLFLKGRWPHNVNVEASLLPQHLVKLTLRCTYLNHNPMLELGKLKSLKKLWLDLDVFSEDWDGPLIFLEGFPALQFLDVRDYHIKEYIVAQGVMPKLTFLRQDPFIAVNLPPELQHVTIEDAC